MASKLRDEIRQKKPFSGIDEEALLNIQRISSYLEHVMQQTFKQHGLTSAQYNALRILRGAGSDGLRCTEIGERMISRDPDITRLLDRLERQGLVGRRRDTRDRRVVHIYISAQGMEMLQGLDPVAVAAGISLLGHMSSARKTLLIELMEEVRQGMEEVRQE